LTIRVVRDYLYDDVDEIWVDGAGEFQRLQSFLGAVMPAFVEKARLYQEQEPMFHRFGVENWVGHIFSRTVPLPSGGEIVIEQTEAMVAIDVNTKRFKVEDSREMILKINREAASEIARQLRLRDMGGLIMLDFVDMEHGADRREIEDLLRREVARDRARTTVLPISQLGVMEMTRQRVRKSVENSLFCTCPECVGAGILKSPDIVAIDFLREVRALLETTEGDVVALMHPDTALAVSNAKRNAIAALENEKQRKIFIGADAAIRRDMFRISVRYNPG
jgi:ribonuclease E